MQKHARKEMLADFCCAVGIKVKKSAEADPFKQANEFLFYLKVNIKPNIYSSFVTTVVILLLFVLSHQ